jgi:hypothetical protein
MENNWERLTDTTYVTSDWYMTVERVGSEWVINERGSVKHREATASDAMAWADKFRAGLVIVI